MKKYIALVMIFMMLSPTFLVLPVALASPLTTNLIDDGDFAEWPGSWTYSKSKDLSIARSTFGNPDNSLWVFASFQASGLQTLVLSQQIGIISGTYDTAILLVDYYASQGAVWDFEWYFEISCGSDTYTSPIFSAEWVLSWQTSTDSSNELITFLNNHAGKQAIFEFNIRIFPDATNREIYFDNIKLEASLTEKKYVVEIEISRFYIKKDFDPLLRPGAADPNFAINILDYDDDFNPSTDPNDDWFKAPIDQDWWKIIFIGGNDIDVGDDELFESFAGPIYIPKAKLTLPIIIKIRVWDDDFAGIADEIISTSLTVGTLPSTFNIENDGAFLEINVRELSVRPLTRTYPISGTENLWYFYEVKADVVRKVYNPNQFEPVRVAIIDTGIDTSKEQLSEKLVFWRDLANDKPVAYDDEGHGTEVAALIAGKTGGIAQNAELVVIKVFPNPDIDRLVNAINIAVSQKAKIISMSLGVTERALGGASSEDVTKLKNAINEAYSKGVVIVAAAGNSRTCLETYPAHLDNVISVSALLRFDPSKGYSSLGDMVTQVPSDDTYLIFADIFSNYGTDCYNARSSIEISAPGCGIKDFDGRNDICGYEDRDYTAGTSFAAPIVSGVAALIIGYAKKAYGVDLTPDQVRRILRASAVDLGPLGWDPYYGYGMVNAYAALKKVDEMFKPTNVDVVLLIDRSGSMGWPISKIEDAKTAAKQFVDLMKIGDKVGVVSFESAVRVEYPLTEIISSETKTSVKAKIDQIYPMGMTAMGDGLRKAYQQLVDHGNPSHPWAIVLMSNGWHNYGTEHPYDVIPDLKSKNIRVYTIGLGAGADSNLLG
ncbi:MAG: S8 family serine peptidase, partial [Candidatus Baldrarchaeia archaeon]